MPPSFFSPTFSSPIQGPRCLDGTPAAWLPPQKADTSLPVQTALEADQGKGPVLAAPLSPLLGGCCGREAAEKRLDHPRAVDPVPVLPVSPQRSSL